MVRSLANYSTTTPTNFFSKQSQYDETILKV